MNIIITVCNNIKCCMRCIFYILIVLRELDDYIHS